MKDSKFQDSEVEYDPISKLPMTHQWNMKRYIITVTTRNNLVRTDPPHPFKFKKELRIDEPVIRFSRKNGATVLNHLDLTQEEWSALTENLERVQKSFITGNLLQKIQLVDKNSNLFLKSSLLTLTGNKGALQFANLNRHYIPETSIKPQYSRKDLTLCSGEWERLTSYHQQISDCLDLYLDSITEETGTSEKLQKKRSLGLRDDTTDEELYRFAERNESMLNNLHVTPEEGSGVLTTNSDIIDVDLIDVESLDKDDPGRVDDEDGMISS